MQELYQSLSYRNSLSALAAYVIHHCVKKNMATDLRSNPYRLNSTKHAFEMMGAVLTITAHPLLS